MSRRRRRSGFAGLANCWAEGEWLLVTGYWGREGRNREWTRICANGIGGSGVALSGYAGTGPASPLGAMPGQGDRERWGLGWQ
jgi:hypothetical protein